MTTTTPPRSTTRSTRTANPWANGFAVFAGVMMAVIGVNQILLGIAAIAEDDVYVRVDDYVYGLDLTAWGWLHLLFGIVLLVATVGVFRAQPWARGLGIGLAALSLVVNFAFIPYYPVGSLLLIALDVAVIWGLAKMQPLDA